MSEKNPSIGRRALLKYVATAVVCGAVAGVGGYYGGITAVPQPKTVTERVTESITKTLTETRTTTQSTTVTQSVTIPATTTVTQTVPTKTSWYEPGGLRAFINYLASRGEVVTVEKEVDPQYEVGGYLWKYEHENPPKAVLFTRVKGSDIPIVGGLYSSWRRIGLALGIKDGLNSKRMRELWFKAIEHPVSPVEVSGGPVQEVVMEGDKVDLRKIPVPTLFEGDGGPYITAGVGISKNPATGKDNMGIYRMQVIDKDHIHVWGSPVSDLWDIYAYHIERKEVMDFAVAIGVDPAITFTAVAKIPQDVSEMAVAGALKGEAIRLTRGKTVDLMVPAGAEIVLEGRIDPSVATKEGPFAEFGGIYKSGTVPVMEVKAVTTRTDPIFHTVISGPSYEHWTLTEQGFVPFWSKNIFDYLKAKGFDNVLDVNIYWHWTMEWIIISLDKKTDEEPRKVINEAFKCDLKTYHMFPVSTWARYIIVVDKDVDIYNFEDVLWAMTALLSQQEQIVTIPDMSSWGFEVVALKDSKTLRVGIDATRPPPLRDKIIRTNTKTVD